MKTYLYIAEELTTMDSKFNLNIPYRWICDQGHKIPKLHLEALKEDAEAIIFEMLIEGNTCGALSTSVRMGKDIVSEEDENNGLTYSGWFDINPKKYIKK